MREDQGVPPYFRLFNEIGILEQLSRTALQSQLPDGVLVSHFTVLNHLVRVQDGRTPLEIANAFQIPKTTMTHTLAGLEKSGFIAMRANEEDARSKRVWLTKKGRNLREKAIQSVASDMQDLELQFSIDRVRKLLPELEALRIIMDERRNTTE
jgi:DNA-binding MarR family transcriptional regulator